MNELKENFGKISASDELKEQTIAKLIALNDKLIAEDEAKKNAPAPERVKKNRSPLFRKLIFAFSIAAAFILMAVFIPVITINSLPPVMLSAPANVRIEGDTLRWDKVKNAAGYEVSLGIYGEEPEVAEVSTNSYSLAGIDTPELYQVKVKALSGGKRYSASDFSKSNYFAGDSLRDVPEDEGDLGTGKRLVVIEGNCLINFYDKSVLLGCSTSVIPEYAKSIGERAFYASGFTEIIIPASVSYIGDEAFNTLSGETSGIIIFEGLTPPDCGNNCFTTAEKIIVPLEALDTYKTALSKYADKITIA